MYKRNDAKTILDRHSALQPRMRAILLDWLIEVCEVYRLHRETFYLAVDFIDRFLGVAPTGLHACGCGRDNCTWTPACGRYNRCPNGVSARGNVDAAQG